MPPSYLTSGYTQKLKPVTPVESVNRRSQTHIKTVVKTAVQNHIRQFLDENGRFRELTRELFPDALRYSTEPFDITPATEAQNKVHLPVYKFSSDIQEHLPCIVINDTGVQYKTAGLGFHQGNFRGENHQIYTIVPVLRSVTLTMLAASPDQTTTEALVDVLSLIFGELAGPTIGMTLYGTGHGENWSARFPKIPEIGSAERANIGDDQKDILWTSLTQMQLEYEDAFLLPFVEGAWKLHNVDPADIPVRRFDMPSLVRVGRQEVGRIFNQNPSEMVSSSDPSVLRLRRGAVPCEYYLVGIRPGEAYVRVTDDVNFKAGPHSNLLEQQKITVGY